MAFYDCVRTLPVPHLPKQLLRFWKKTAHFGYPHTIVSDNATTFSSAKFQEWCHYRGIKHLTGAPYHPATINATHAMQPRAMHPRAMHPRAMQPHVVLSIELGSQQKADVVKTDYSDSLLMITRLKTRIIITIDAAHITLN